MAMSPFHILFPDIAERECRTIALLNHESLPPHTFLFMELYCSAPNCDCRRVMLNVIDTDIKKHVATINHGFEPPEPRFKDEKQTFLDPLNPQSPMSKALLDAFLDMISMDNDYRERLLRHYAMWKEVIDDPSHPDNHKIRLPEYDDPDYRPTFPKPPTFRREAPKVGPNDPCSCGSGKKFKKCCRE